MKKNLLLLSLLFMFSQIMFSQIFYGEDKLSSSRMTGKKVGNIAGAYFTLGLSSAKRNIVIEGKESYTKIQDTKPEFEIELNDPKLSGYGEENIVLMKLHQKGKSRNLRIGKYGLTAGVQSGLNEDDMIPIDIERDGEILIIRPKGDLKKGQYCFYYVGDLPEGVDPSIYVYDFEIVK